VKFSQSLYLTATIDISTFTITVGRFATSTVFPCWSKCPHQNSPYTSLFVQTGACPWTQIERDLTNISQKSFRRPRFKTNFGLFFFKFCMDLLLRFPVLNIPDT